MRRHLTLTMIAVLVTSLAGCDLIGEELAEQAAEQVTGADIEVDEDGVSVEHEEGSFSADAEGGMTMETDEGSFASQTGEIPEDFPSAVPLVDGGTLIQGSRLDTEDGTAWTVAWQFDSGDPGEVLEAQAKVLEDAGFTTEQEVSFGGGDEGGLASVLFSGDEYAVNLGLLGETDDFVVQYQVYENPPDE